MNYPAYQFKQAHFQENTMDEQQRSDIHQPVMLKESIHGLKINPSGCYVDATFGRGGHSRQILAQLGPSGRLIVLDRDPSAIRVAEELADEDGRVTVCHGVFSELNDFLEDDEAIDGALFDLGVSSPQLDQADRGFSFQQDGPLDMRMNNAQGLSAADWLARADKDEIIWVLQTYGEEGYAEAVADKIIQRRQEQPIVTTKDLVDTVLSALPRLLNNKHPATKIFQAIRMHINAELDEIHYGMTQVAQKIRPGGRLVVISYHSIEHKQVSDALKQLQADAALSDANSKLPKLRKVGHALRAGRDEIYGNRRARSALLRTWEVKS